MKDYIKTECIIIEQLLVQKNKSYGNSVSDPIGIFSKLGNVEQINVRIDDKINRLKHGQVYGNEDTELDLIGYLILKRCVKRRNEDMANDQKF